MKKTTLFTILFALLSSPAFATSSFDCSFNDGLQVGGWAPRMANAAPFVTYIQLADGTGHQISQQQVRGYKEAKNGKILSFSFRALGMTFRYNRGRLTRNGRSSRGSCSIN